MSANTANLLYLVTIASFILSLRFLSSPRRARLGTWIGAFGMAWAIVVTLGLDEVVTGYWFIALGMAIGAVIGAVGARTVKMTAMPQMVLCSTASAAALRRSSRWSSSTASGRTSATSARSRASRRCSPASSARSPSRDR